jgi:hypothetical protein
MQVQVSLLRAAWQQGCSLFVSAEHTEGATHFSKGSNSTNAQRRPMPIS